MPRRKKDRGRGAVEKLAVRLETLEISYVPVTQVGPNLYNPNRQTDHDFELLLRSMEDDGFTQPVIVREKDNMIVDGEHRWMAWIVLNALAREGKTVSDVSSSHLNDLRDRRLELLEEMEDVLFPVVMTDMTDEQMRISTLRHNRARGSEDLELGANVLKDLRELGASEWAQEALMLTDEEMQVLLDDIPAPEALAGEEYEEGWEPTEPTEGHNIGLDGAAAGSSLTAAAAEQLRERERRLAEAKTTEEREMIRADSAIYRLICVFAGDQAEVVKRVLGKEPASMVMFMCLHLETEPDALAEIRIRVEAIKGSVPEGAPA